MTELAGWANFYVIVGSSAGALIGLQFIVITLIANFPILRGQAQAGAAFATPTIVHLGAVLLLSGILSAAYDSADFNFPAVRRLSQRDSICVYVEH